MAADMFDLAIIGGGINGTGIARDAAGRGLSVLLVEQDDLAAHTSSASTKLIHGGLRYLEYCEFRLVREALRERERLLRIAPHLIRPLCFVLPMPEFGRPAWMIRLGLWLYDHIGGRISLPRSYQASLSEQPWRGSLRPGLVKAFVYSDCWVDDARLVVANAQDAAERGATVLTGVAVIGARPVGEHWELDLAANPTRPRVEGAPPTMARTRALVNAAGPWVVSLLGAIDGARREGGIRLVKGSHIVVPRWYDGDHAFIFQNPDGRIMFTIPYLDRFTLIGTTDVLVGEDERACPTISDAEVDYILDGANSYLARPVARTDIVSTYAGVRALYDDGSADAKAITRDYVLQRGREAGPQVLSVFGGKLTTYRRLAEQALAELAPWLAPMGPAWTDQQALPGGDVPQGDMTEYTRKTRRRWPFLDEAVARRLVRAYGTRIERILGKAQVWSDLGEDFGAGLTAAEVRYLVTREWARTAEDILWRRTKLGLVCPPGSFEKLDRWLAEYLQETKG